jgi:hypothetical protein
VSTDVSEEYIAFIVRAEEISSTSNQRASRWEGFQKMVLFILVSYSIPALDSVLLNNSPTNKLICKNTP